MLKNNTTVPVFSCINGSQVMCDLEVHTKLNLYLLE